MDTLKLKDTLLELVEELRIARITISENEKRIKHLVSECHEKERRLEEEVSRQHTLRDEHTEAVNSVRGSFDIKIKQLEAEKNKLQLMSGSWEKEMKILKDDIRTLQLAKYNLERAVCEQSHRLQTQGQSKSAHTQQVAEIEMKCKDILQQVAVYGDTLDDLRKEATEAGRLNRLLESTHRHQECRLSSVGAELEGKREELIQLRARLATDPGDEGKVDKKQMDLKMEHLRSELQQLSDANKVLQDQLEDVRKTQQVTQEQLREAQALAHRCMALSKEAARRNCEKEAQLVKLAQELKEQKEGRGETLDKFNQTSQKLELLQQQKEGEVLALTDDIQRFKGECSALRKAQSNLEDLNTTWASKNQTLSNNVRKLELELEGKVRDIAKLKEKTSNSHAEGGTQTEAEKTHDASCWTGEMFKEEIIKKMEVDAYSGLQKTDGMSSVENVAHDGNVLKKGVTPGDPVISAVEELNAKIDANLEPKGKLIVSPKSEGCDVACMGLQREFAIHGMAQTQEDINDVNDPGDIRGPKCKESATGVEDKLLLEHALPGAVIEVITSECQEEKHRALTTEEKTCDKPSRDSFQEGNVVEYCPQRGNIMTNRMTQSKPEKANDGDGSRDDSPMSPRCTSERNSLHESSRKRVECLTECNGKSEINVYKQAVKDDQLCTLEVTDSTTIQEMGIPGKEDSLLESMKTSILDACKIGPEQIEASELNVSTSVQSLPGKSAPDDTKGKLINSSPGLVETFGNGSEDSKGKDSNTVTKKNFSPTDNVRSNVLVTVAPPGISSAKSEKNEQDSGEDDEDLVIPSTYVQETNILSQDTKKATTWKDPDKTSVFTFRHEAASPEGCSNAEQPMERPTSTYRSSRYGVLSEKGSAALHSPSATMRWIGSSGLTSSPSSIGPPRRVPLLTSCLSTQQSVTSALTSKCPTALRHLRHRDEPSPYESVPAGTDSSQDYPKDFMLAPKRSDKGLLFQGKRSLCTTSTASSANSILEQQPPAKVQARTATMFSPLQTAHQIHRSLHGFSNVSQPMTSISANVPAVSSSQGVFIPSHCDTIRSSTLHSRVGTAGLNAESALQGQSSSHLNSGKGEQPLSADERSSSTPVQGAIIRPALTDAKKIIHPHPHLLVLTPCTSPVASGHGKEGRGDADGEACLFSDDDDGDMKEGMASQIDRIQTFLQRDRLKRGKTEAM